MNKPILLRIQFASQDMNWILEKGTRFCFVLINPALTRRPCSVSLHVKFEYVNVILTRDTKTDIINTKTASVSIDTSETPIADDDSSTNLITRSPNISDRSCKADMLNASTIKNAWRWFAESPSLSISLAESLIIGISRSRTRVGDIRVVRRTDHIEIRGFDIHCPKCSRKCFGLHSKQ